MSDWVFQPFILMATNSNDQEIVAMKFIESMTVLDITSEDETIERLKDDRHLFCRTVSGKEYLISMQAQMKNFVTYKLPSDPIKLRQCIFEKWYHMVSS